jgi:aquaporin Z
MADETAGVEADSFQEDLDQEVWVEDNSGPSLLAKMGAEATGTFILVLLGVGAALLSGLGNNGTLTVGLAFGIAVLIGAIVFGGVSGGHFNPAVTIGAWLSGRSSALDIAPYIVAQLVGAVAAGAVLFAGVTSLEQADSTVARGFLSSTSIGYGEHAPLAASGFNFGLGIAIFVEIIATGLLMLVILGSTTPKAPKGIAPFAIALSLAILVVWTIPFTNGALNPARATATAIFSDSWALSQLWVFWVAPILGAAIVGLLWRAFGPDETVEEIEVLEVIED